MAQGCETQLQIAGAGWHWALRVQGALIWGQPVVCGFSPGFRLLGWRLEG